MMIANNKHDLVALRINDPAENNLPNVGLIRLNDAENGEEFWVDTAREKNQTTYKTWRNDLEQYFNRSITKSGVDSVNIQTNEDYVIPLIKLFNKRSL